MEITVADRVKETTTTTGTGTVNLAGAVTGFKTFVAGAGAGAKVWYAIVGQAGGGAEGEWEIGKGTVTDAAPDTLSRDTVRSSSNSDAAVTFSAGTKDVFLIMPANVVPVALQVQTPSAAAQIDFDISGFEMVELVGWLQPATDAVTLFIRLSNDGGSSFRVASTDYDSVVHYGYTHDDTTAVLGDTGLTGIKLGQNIGNGATEGIEFRVRIVNPADADWYTSVLGEVGEVDLGGNKFYANLGGRVRSAKEVNDAVRFIFSSGNIADGRVAMYGYPAP